MGSWIRLIEPPSAPAPRLTSHAIDTFGMPVRQSRETWHDIVDGTNHLEERTDQDHGSRVPRQVWFPKDLMLAPSPERRMS